MWRTRNVKDELAHIWFERDFKEAPVDIMLRVLVSTAFAIIISLLTIQWNPQLPKSALKGIVMVYNGVKIYFVLENVYVDLPKLNVSLVNILLILGSYFGWKLMFKGSINAKNPNFNLNIIYLTDVLANIWWGTYMCYFAINESGFSHKGSKLIEMFIFKQIGDLATISLFEPGLQKGRIAKTALFLCIGVALGILTCVAPPVYFYGFGLTTTLKNGLPSQACAGLYIYEMIDVQWSLLRAQSAEKKAPDTTRTKFINFIQTASALWHISLGVILAHGLYVHG